MSAAQKDPVLVAARVVLAERVGAAAVRALELHDSILANERSAALDTVDRFGAMLRVLSTEAGAVEALRALRQEKTSPDFARPWAAERRRRPSWVEPAADVEIATGELRDPAEEPRVVNGRPEYSGRGRVSLVKLASGGAELRISDLALTAAPDDREEKRIAGSAAIHIEWEERKMLPVLSSRDRLGDGPDDSDVVLPALRDRYGSMRVPLPDGALDPSRGFLSIWNGRRLRLVAALRFAQTQAQTAPANALDDSIMPDDDDEAA